MTPSMKPGNYQVYLLIKREADLGSATCQCVAGYVNQYTYNVFNRKSASCTHVSALLHGLLSISPRNCNSRSEDTEEDDTLPCTSYLCQWKPPRKRKESCVSEAHIWKRKKTNL